MPTVLVEVPNQLADCAGRLGLRAAGIHNGEMLHQLADVQVIGAPSLEDV